MNEPRASLVQIKKGEKRREREREGERERERERKEGEGGVERRGRKWESSQEI